jgi:hypothetical protein
MSGLSWTPWAVPGIVALLVAWSAAIVLLRTAPDRSLNRRLAFVLFLEGLWLGASVFFMVEDRDVFLFIAAIGVAAMAALPFQYLSFLGLALDTRLVAPFRSRTVFILLGVASAAAGLAVLVSPSSWLGELYSPPWATWNFHFRPWGAAVAQIHGIASLFGLLAAVSAYLKAQPGTDARSRAKWFAIAFGVRDTFNAISWIFYPTLRPITFWGDFIYNPGPAIINIGYVALIAYGVLRAQLFDIDLKLKLALKQSTVGAVIAGGFFTGSELLERVIPVESGILGLLLAGVIVLLLRPVQRFAQALADRIMRGVEDTPDYRESRKHEVYRAALEGAMTDGAITEKERRILSRLREQLGFSAEVADGIEREMLSSLSQAR